MGGGLLSSRRFFLLRVRRGTQVTANNRIQQDAVVCVEQPLIFSRNNSSKLPRLHTPQMTGTQNRYPGTDQHCSKASHRSHRRAGSDRILFDVMGRRTEMVFIPHEAIEAISLPDDTRAIHSLVEFMSSEGLPVLDNPRQRPPGSWPIRAWR